MAARRAAAAGEELESRHADALGQEMRRGSLPGHAAAHSALADVTAGGPYLDDTVEMLGKVEKQAQELAGSVDTMLSTLATKMGDIAQTDYTIQYILGGSACEHTNSEHFNGHDKT